MITTRTKPRLLTLGALFMFVGAACTGGGGASSGPTAGPTSGGGSTPAATSGGGQSAAPSTATGGGYDKWVPDPTLLTAAKGEGSLTTIALPHDWCNYGSQEGVTGPNVLDTFKERTGLTINELDPLAGSGDEIEAIKANKDNPGPQAPDVVDVGLSFGNSGKADGLFAPYKVKTWDSIPASAKDPDGAWYGDYYGVLAFETNTEAIATPAKDWSDLLGDGFKNKVALAGDPRASNQAILSVVAAGLANGGSLDDATKGLEFFKQMKEKGNLLPTIATAALVASGETPMTIRWTYNALSSRDATAAAGGPKIDVTVPTNGRFAGVYVQAISKYAPHPNAAKLWMEFLYSDEGQNLWLRGYCHPIRYEDLVKNNKVPAEQLAKLPDVTGAVFPTLDQLTKTNAQVTKNWDSVVGLDIKPKPTP